MLQTAGLFHSFHPYSRPWTCSVWIAAVIPSDTNGLLDANQFDYSVMHSTNTSITAATEALYKDRVNSLSSFLILLDLWITRSSFPTHANFGTSNYALIWFSSFLQDQSYHQPPTLPPKHTHTYSHSALLLESHRVQYLVYYCSLYILLNY